MTLRELLDYIDMQVAAGASPMDYDFTIGNQYDLLQPIDSTDAILVSDGAHTIMIKLTAEQAQALHESKPAGFDDVEEPVVGNTWNNPVAGE